MEYVAKGDTHKFITRLVYDGRENPWDWAAVAEPGEFELLTGRAPTSLDSCYAWRNPSDFCPCPDIRSPTTVRITAGNDVTAAGAGGASVEHEPGTQVSVFLSRRLVERLRAHIEAAGADDKSADDEDGENGAAKIATTVTKPQFAPQPPATPAPGAGGRRPMGALVGFNGIKHRK